MTDDSKNVKDNKCSCSNRIKELEFQLEQLKALGKYHSRMKEDEKRALKSVDVKDKLKLLTKKEFMFGAETISNFLYMNVLVGIYRYNPNNKSFEYAMDMGDDKTIAWKTDTKVKLLTEIVFSPLYLRCKEIYDEEMIKLHSQCFAGDKDDGVNFAIKRDEIRANIDTIMDLSNGITDKRTKRYLSTLLINLVKMVQR